MSKCPEKLSNAQCEEQLIPREQIRKLNTALSAVVERLMESLGWDLTTCYLHQDYIRGPTLCHDGDNHTGFIYYHNQQYWMCFTQNCETKYGTDLIGLIRAILKISFKEAVVWAEDFVTRNKVDQKTIERIQMHRDKAQQQRRRNGWIMHRGQKQYEESWLGRLSSPGIFCEHRKFPVELFNEYGIGYALTGKMVGRIVVPVRNVYGKLIGFTGRIVRAQQSSCKWLHFGFEKNYNLFNVDRAFHALCDNRKDVIVLVEGPFDALKLVQAGISNVVAIFGSNINDGQVEVLKHIGVSKALIAMDADKAGKEAAERIHKILEKNLLSSGIIDIEAELRALSPFAEWKGYRHWEDNRFGRPDWGHTELPICVIPKVFGRYL